MWLDRALTPKKTVFMNWQMLRAASVNDTQNVSSLKHITPKNVSVEIGTWHWQHRTEWFWRNKLIIGCTLTDKYYINSTWVIGIFWLEHFVPGLASRHCMVALESKTNKQTKPKMKLTQIYQSSYPDDLVSFLKTTHTASQSHRVAHFNQISLKLWNSGGQKWYHRTPPLSKYFPPLAPEVAQTSSGVARHRDTLCSVWKRSCFASGISGGGIFVFTYHHSLMHKLLADSRCIWTVTSWYLSLNCMKTVQHVEGVRDWLHTLDHTFNWSVFPRNVWTCDCGENAGGITDVLQLSKRSCKMQTQFDVGQPVQTIQLHFL